MMWQWNFRVKNADVYRTSRPDALVASGALDDVFAKMDAGQPLTGESGLLNSVAEGDPGTRAEHRADRAPRL